MCPPDLGGCLAERGDGAAGFVNQASRPPGRGCEVLKKQESAKISAEN